MRKKELKIVFLGLGVELALCLLYFIWTIFRPNKFVFSCSYLSTIQGFIITVPLLCINVLLFRTRIAKYHGLRSSQQFINTIIKPFVDEISVFSSILISFAAGFGEELFFRGTLLEETGIIFSSAIFSFLHFGTAMGRYKLLSFFYFLIGIYFSLMVINTGSLWVVIFAHASYDFIVILYMKYVWPLKNTWD